MLIYSKMGSSEVVDLDQLKCLVGRVQNGGYTAIIDRTGEWQDVMHARDDWVFARLSVDILMFLLELEIEERNELEINHECADYYLGGSSVMSPRMCIAINGTYSAEVKYGINLNNTSS
jgi:hypothetical protein